MKILLYSDIHISRTSSILPLNSSNPKYTYRQNMILELGKYLADIADKYTPDLIINLGDTFDNHTLTSYDIDVASEFFKCFEHINIPHLVIVGNHEMINQDFNAIRILNNITNIRVISQSCSIDTNDLVLGKSLESLQLAFLPYCDYKDILEFPTGQLLFSHIDIAGSSIRKNVVLPTGIEQTTLKNNYKLIFNGHIHKPSIMQNIINVGSTTTHSFSDDEDSVPQCYIYDTETNDLQIFKPTCCPLFRKCNISTLQELTEYVDNLDSNYKYILHITCPYEIKEDVKVYIRDNDKVLNQRLNLKITQKEEQLKQQQEKLNDVHLNEDVIKSFNDFLDTTELKYPKELYSQVLNEEV